MLNKVWHVNWIFFDFLYPITYISLYPNSRYTESVAVPTVNLKLPMKMGSIGCIMVTIQQKSKVDDSNLTAPGI